MKISVVTICYNSENEISKTIESILDQEIEEVEYIIVDGNSSDKTVAVAKEYEKFFLKKKWEYKIISEKDNGIYDAMNKGVNCSSGDIVGILNSGDWYEKGALQQIAKTFSFEMVDYCFADIFIVDANNNKMIKKAKKDIHPSSRHWNHPTMFVKKIVYDKYGGYKCIGIHDDFDFYLRLRRANLYYSVINEPLANFVLGGVSNKKSLSNSKKRIKDRYRCYLDNGYSRFYWFECFFIEILKYIFT